MSILVKGMKMPKDYLRCPFRNSITEQCLASEKWCDGFDGDCPLVEIKPHGRLIDADALSNDLMYDVELNSDALDSLEIANKKEREQLELDRDCKQNCARYVDDAPTVLEAEG